MATIGKEPFIEGLIELGYNPINLDGNKLSFKYKIGAGRFQNQEIAVGIDVPSDFNVTCPSGPHITPRLIPLNPSAMGNDRAAESPQFGPDWEYLSRPFIDRDAGWNRTTRTVKAYLHHVKRILDNL